MKHASAARSRPPTGKRAFDIPTADSSFFSEAAKQTLTNARALLRASDALAESRRFPVAHSLLVLSLEELSKAVFFHLVLEGLTSPDKGQRTFLGRLLPDHLRQHWVKQVAIGSLMIGLYYRARLNGLFRRFYGRVPTDTEVDFFTPLVFQPRDRLPAAQRLRDPRARELRRIAVDVSELQHVMTTLESQKQQGFYVDVNMKMQTIGLPKRIRKRDYLRLRGVANGAFPLVGWMVKYGYTPEGKTHIMELVQFGRTDWTKRG